MRRTMSATAESVGIAREPQFQALLGRWQSRIESELSARLPPATLRPARLHEALRYSALGGGKRVRPVLAYATASALGISEASVDGVACSVELIHAYSLVHDDLPAMDDDDLRRGRPTCHKAFDEATAILVGDALQVLAFETLASGPGLPADAAPQKRSAERRSPKNTRSRQVSCPDRVSSGFAYVRGNRLRNRHPEDAADESGSGLDRYPTDITVRIHAVSVRFGKANR